MRKLTLIIIVLLIVGLGFALARVATLQRERADLQERLRPFEEKLRAAARINEEFVVSAGTIQRFTFSPATVPGTLSGSWRSSGRGFGGADDTIAAFRLTDPKDVVLESSSREASGRFLIKLSEAGTYSFFFDNGGLLRSTPRRVFLEAEFKPD